jgi:hypothetical protein
VIYEFPIASEPVRQGDIFRNIPRVDLDLSALGVISASGPPRQMSWRDVISTVAPPVTAVVAIRPVIAIVITQDCDAVRSPEIALCEVGVFREVERFARATASPKSWASVITQHARINQKWYYLPPDMGIGFVDKMAVDFRTVLRISRDDIDDAIPDLRIGRLNEIALAHFRERVGEFFRRYPYDEWYALDREELAAYKADKPEPVPPFPWQT